jgi:DNA repair protein RadC
MRIYETTLAFNLVQLGEPTALETPAKVVEYLQSGIDRNPVQESFWVIPLDRKNKPIGRHMVTLGTLTSSLVAPREVARIVILAGAAAFIIAHNHPSGDPTPSSADISVTRKLREAAQAIDIALLDHVVVGTPEGDPTGRGWYSMREAGLL